LQTLTFYSYKGGVGRTLMVANMARYLASFGKKVLAVDFDLEAPGLHYKLGFANPERGLIDYLHQLFLVEEIPESLAPYVVAIEEENAAGGSIHLLPAGAAPSPAYWRQLSRLNWHELFYSEEAPGVPLFLELQERIAREYAPDFLLIDSRTGITEVGGATTTLLADRVICLLLNNRENLDGSREVLRSLRRAPRLTGQAPLEIWPVLSRIPEVGGEREAGLIREVRDFLCAEAEDLASTLTFPELFVLHSDPELQLREVLCIGAEAGPEESILLRDYLALFGKLVPIHVLVGPTVRAIAERWETDKANAERDFAKLGELAPPEGLQALLDAELARVHEEKSFHEAAAALGLLREIDPSADLAATLKAYLSYLVASHGYLSFKGMGITDRVPLRLPLLDMYVPLKVRQEAPEGETLAQELRLAGRRMTAEEREAVGERLSGPQPALDLLRRHDGLVLLGDPGSGKTTFLKFLLLSLAAGEGESLGLGVRLPVYWPLAAWARSLAAGETLAFEELLAQYYRDVHPAIGELVARGLAAGRALLLLDGLDEVHDRALQAEVGRRVVALYEACRERGNKLVLTSRIVGYREVRLNASGLAEATLVDFGAEEIDEFAAKWTAALETAAAGSSALTLLTVAREREELLAAVHGNPRVEELAANPLLLTILALMKRQGVTLPERRVELYEQYVKTLLYSWNLARTGEGMEVAGALRVLAPLALWMQQTSPGAGLVEEEALRGKLAELCGGPEAAERLLADVRRYAGLLIERGPRRYGFLHLTFQEYLAGMALGEQVQEGVGAVLAALRPLVGQAEWREVCLLAIGYLARVLRLTRAASVVLESLLAERPGKPGEAEILAGQALADVGLDGVTANCRGTVVGALLEALGDDHRLSPRHRAQAGKALASVGDPRRAVMTVDGMEFCQVPAGAFWMGSGKKEKDASSAEKPRHWVELPYDYQIGRFPVSKAQFKEFVATSGYEGWKIGAYSAAANEPAVDVTWHDATAFCRWLTERWRKTGRLPEGWEVRLPSEAEWERAARGDDGRRYPWGEVFDANRVNSEESRIDGPSALGCFPGGRSRWGCEELSGNVWEWTRSLYDGYPYPEPGSERQIREALAAKGPRVLRGGAFDLDAAFVRCAVRRRDYPSYRLRNFGFRVVLLPFSSDL
jgi:formylglycine-generating enzyme required for sulfatase activity